MKITVNQTEVELLGLIGDIVFEKTEVEGVIIEKRPTEISLVEVEFIYPVYLDFAQLMQILESAIERQESDMGDWLRAKLYREAKPLLLSKLRKATLKAVNNA